jgi:hypothetical protein
LGRSIRRRDSSRESRRAVGAGQIAHLVVVGIQQKLGFLDLFEHVAVFVVAARDIL